MAAFLPDMYWLTPVMMLASLMLGGLFALGHHVFYSALAGKVTPSDTLGIMGLEVSKQQINIATGSALAFLFKMALVGAMSTAYVQIFWHLRKCAKRDVTLTELDATFSPSLGLSTITQLSVWIKYPFLFLLVLSIALIPISSIITPATLSVVNAPMQPPPTDMSNDLAYLSPTFSNLNLLAPMAAPTLGDYNPWYYDYTGPSPALQKVATAVAAQGAVLSVSPPAPNVSWTLSFPGPSLTCQNASSAQKSAVLDNIYLKGGQGIYAYLAWAPLMASGYNTTQYLPFPSNATSHALLVDGTNFMTFDATTADTMFYLAALSVSIDLERGPTIYDDTDYHDQWSTLIQCRLHNGTYTADIEYVNGERTIAVTVTDKGPPLSALPGIWGPSQAWGGTAMVTSNHQANCSTFNTANNACAFDVEELQGLSYQAVMHAFVTLFAGAIAQEEGVLEASGVQSTSLLQTKELRFLQDWFYGSDMNGISLYLQSASMLDSGDMFSGIYRDPNTPSDMPLSEALEQLFQNITLSLAGSPELQPNKSSPFLPPSVDISYKFWRNVYDYSALKLWLAYGTALLVATIVVAAGFAALLSNGVSYSNTFSTVVRTTRHAAMTQEVQAVDRDGKDPLPKSLVDAKITLTAPLQQRQFPSRNGQVEYVKVEQDGERDPE